MLIALWKIGLEERDGKKGKRVVHQMKNGRGQPKIWERRKKKQTLDQQPVAAAAVLTLEFWV